MNEKHFQKWVVDTAKGYGWRCWHTPTPMRPISGGKFVPDSRGRGLPDLLMIHDDPPRLIFAELKGDGRHPLSPDQLVFLRLAKGVAQACEDVDGYRLIGVYSWRPGSEDLVEAILRGKVLS